MAQIEYVKARRGGHHQGAKWHVRRPGTARGRHWSLCGWYWSENDATITMEEPDNTCSLCLNRPEYKTLVAEQRAGSDAT